MTSMRSSQLATLLGVVAAISLFAAPLITNAQQVQTTTPTITTAPIYSSYTSISGTSEADASIVFTDTTTNFTTTVNADNNGNWTVSGLTLSTGDVISVTATGNGESTSNAATATVTSTPVIPVFTFPTPPTPSTTATPTITTPVYSTQTSVSGTSADSANISLSVNGGTPETAIADANGNWTVSGLTLADGDSISVTAQAGADLVSSAATATVVSPCSTTNSPFVTFTQNISNDPDSGYSGGAGGDWAMDTFTENVSLWVGGDQQTYCATANTTNGTFITTGPKSPEAGVALSPGISGTFTGGETYVLPSSLTLDPSYSTTTTNAITLPANTCGGDGSGCASGAFSKWVNDAFTNANADGSTYVNTYSLTYVTQNNGTWTDAGTGDSGDITGSPSAVYVNGSTGNDTTGNGTQSKPYATIQKGIEEVSSGGTVNVEAGTYSNVQLSGSYNSNIIVQGDATSTTFIDGLDLSGSTFDGLTFKNFTFEGSSSGYSGYSVTIDADGTYSNLAFDNDTFDGQSTANQGAIFLNRGFDGFTLENDAFQNYDGSSYGTVYSVVFAEAQSSVWGDNFTATGNSLTGSTAKNFLETYRWKDVSFTNNTVNADGGRLLVWSDTQRGALESLGTIDISGNTMNLDEGTGIEVYEAMDTTVNITDNTVTGADTCVMSDSVSTTNVTGNTLTDCSTGLSLAEDGATTASSVTVSDNTFSGNTAGLDDSTALSVAADHNWWGNASGPYNATNNPSGTGDSVTDNVSFSPWYTNSGMTTLEYSTSTSGSDTIATTGSSSTTLEGTSTANGSVNVTAVIPANTIITGDSSWDGVLNAPSSTTATVNVSGFTTSVTSAVTIGSNESDLLFSNPVELTFTGEAGQHVGFFNNAGNFSEITEVCDGVNTPTVSGNALSTTAPGEACKVDNGNDLVVWTTHFSTFVTYATTAVVSSGGGGGNGPIAGGGGGGTVAVALPNNGGAAVTTATTGSTGTTGTGGQVLGAAAYNFATNFGIGATGEDVTQLQTILIADGYLDISAPTGWFGPLTKAAVEKYQKANGIPDTGFVGPLTRAQLNQGVTPTSSDELQSLEQELASLEAQIAALTGTSTTSSTSTATTTTQ